MRRALTILLCAAPLTLFADSFDQAKRLAYRAPVEALAMLPTLNRAADKAAIERMAILRATSIDQATAAREIERWIGAPWLGDILFADAVGVAKLVEDEGSARRLLLASAARHPEAALQNWPRMAGLSHGLEALEAAALQAPDEAVAILTGTSPYSQELNEAFEHSTNPGMQRLLQFAHDDGIAAPLRVRRAFADLPIAILNDPASYFHALAELRLGARGDHAVLDRGLSLAATELCQAYQQSPRQAPEIARLSMRDLYLLLAYGRAGDEDTYFAKLFDRLAARGNLARVIGEADNLRLREFLEYSLWFRRYPQLLRAAGNEAAAAQILAPLFHGLEIDNALTAADAIAATPETIRHHLRTVLREQQARTAEQSNIKQGLTMSLLRRAGEAGPLKSPALAANASTVLERYFFYDDADGVDSFGSFRTQYAHDSAWRWESMDGWIRLRTRGIEIVANVPVDSLSADNRVTEAERAQRQRNVDDYLGEREPSVIVHRGHAYHVEKTLRYVTRETRLVYLGSCRGLKDLRTAIESAPQADIISTRAVGTKRVNDPLLKMLNGAILRSRSVDWPVLWSAASGRFAAESDFAGYIPPHHNGAAAFLRFYDAALSNLDLASQATAQK